MSSRPRAFRPIKTINIPHPDQQYMHQDHSPRAQDLVADISLLVSHVQVSCCVCVREHCDSSLPGVRLEHSRLQEEVRKCAVGKATRSFSKLLRAHRYQSTSPSLSILPSKKRKKKKILGPTTAWNLFWLEQAERRDFAFKDGVCHHKEKGFCVCIESCHISFL